MVKSTPLPNGSVILKTRRGVNVGLFILGLILLLAVTLAISVGTLFSPNSLALGQEQALRLFHGGIAGRHEETFVDGCVQVEGTESPQAITRTRRLTLFNDGTTLEVIFSGRPAPTNACP